MPDSFLEAFPYITVALFGLALLLMVLSIRLFRRSRTDVFWRRRREAGQRGWRLFLLSAVILIASGLACAATALNAWLPDDNKKRTTPTTAAAEISTLPPDEATAFQLTASPSPLPTATAEPQSTPILTPADTPTPVVIIVTSTPMVALATASQPTFTPNAPPLVSSITPEPDAQITITALDDQISSDYQAITPRSTFDTGTTRIYLFVQFQNMTPGVLWRRELYYDNSLLEEHSYLWGSETQGDGYFFFGSGSGFVPGSYEVRLYIGDSSAPISVMPFTIAEAS
jgi:hypothetical protein